MTSINGFSVGERATVGIKTFRVPGLDILLPVRTEVAPLLIGFALEFHHHVEELVPGWCWGYALRAVRGSTVPSFHGAGIALDLNAPRHPLGKRGTFSATQAAACRSLAAKYGLRWGGDYVKRADEMHFEIITPRAQALRTVERLQAPAATSTPPPTTTTPAAATTRTTTASSTTDEDDMANPILIFGDPDHPGKLFAGFTGSGLASHIADPAALDRLKGIKTASGKPLAIEVPPTKGLLASFTFVEEGKSLVVSIAPTPSL